jgi:hypothetical protein
VLLILSHRRRDFIALVIWHHRRGYCGLYSRRYRCVFGTDNTPFWELIADFIPASLSALGVLLSGTIDVVFPVGSTTASYPNTALLQTSCAELMACRTIVFMSNDPW